ncbi:hypothetical protein PPBDW_II0553 [Photobacterium kishitanii]|nr:hypothetical protein PPBDW_II0553 [Photobacterium kishitanii]
MSINLSSHSFNIFKKLLAFRAILETILYSVIMDVTHGFVITQYAH